MISYYFHKSSYFGKTLSDCQKDKEIITEQAISLVGYEHKYITAGLGEVLQLYLLI